MPDFYKPVAPKIDTENSISSGLVFDCPFFEGFGTSVAELVSSTTSSLSGAPTWINSSGYGWGLNFSNSADIASFTVSSSVQSLATQSYEAIASTSVDSSNGGTPRRLFHKDNINGDTYLQIFLNDSSSTSGMMAIVSKRTTTSGRWEFSAFSAINTLFHIVITYDNSSTSNNPLVYINGSAVSVTRAVAPSGTLPADDANLYIGNRQDLTRAWSGKILYGRVWNRILTSNEISLLYQNPWRIYLQRKLNNYQFPSGSGLNFGERIR